MDAKTVSIIIRIIIFLIPFLIIFVMSRLSGKSYTNSMADYGLYKRYFAAALFSLFLILALSFAAKEYDIYKTSKGKDAEHAYTLFKISIFATAIFTFFLIAISISIHVLKQLPIKQRARIEGFNRTANGVRTAFDIFRS